MKHKRSTVLISVFIVFLFLCFVIVIAIKEDSFRYIGWNTNRKVKKIPIRISDILTINLPPGRDDPALYIHFKDYSHRFTENEQKIVEQKINDLIRDSNKVILTYDRWEKRNKYKEAEIFSYTVDITNSNISAEIAGLFFFEEKPTIPADSLIMDNPLASIVFYPSGIQFDFHWIGDVEKSSPHIRSVEYKYQRLEGKINKAFVEKCLLLPVHNGQNIREL